MDVVLIILGVLGLGAIVISAYVFTVAARNYVSDDHNHQQPAAGATGLVKRSPVDRRSNRPIQFPLSVNGELIPEDRRQQPDRRRAMAA